MFDVSQYLSSNRHGAQVHHLIHEVVVVLLELGHFLLADHLQVVVQRVGSNDLN